MKYDDLHISVKSSFGIFFKNNNLVEFRTGSTSGESFVLFDSSNRGILASVIERLLNKDPRRPFNSTERDLIKELIPQLHEKGILAKDSTTLEDEKKDGTTSTSKILLVGHGALARSLFQQLEHLKCRHVKVVVSSSVSSVPRTVFKHDFPEALPSPLSINEWKDLMTSADHTVVAQDSFEPEELTSINSASLICKKAWTLVCLDGYEGWIGPTFVPFQTPCFTCFQQRLQANAGQPANVLGEYGVRAYRMPAAWDVGIEAFAWLSLLSSIFAMNFEEMCQDKGFTLGKMIVIHRPNLSFHSETVLRIPRCVSCYSRTSGPSMNVFSHILSHRWTKDTDGTNKPK